MFSCHNTTRGELSEAENLGGALLAAYTHLVTNGEEPPIVVCEDNDPIVTFSWMPVGAGRVVRATVEKGRA